MVIIVLLKQKFEEDKLPSVYIIDSKIYNYPHALWYHLPVGGVVYLAICYNNIACKLERKKDQIIES